MCYSEKNCKTYITARSCDLEPGLYLQISTENHQEQCCIILIDYLFITFWSWFSGQLNWYQIIQHCCDLGGNYFIFHYKLKTENYFVLVYFALLWTIETILYFIKKSLIFPLITADKKFSFFLIGGRNGWFKQWMWARNQETNHWYGSWNGSWRSYLITWSHNPVDPQCTVHSAYR